MKATKKLIPLFSLLIVVLFSTQLIAVEELSYRQRAAKASDMEIAKDRVLVKYHAGVKRSTIAPFLSAIDAKPAENLQRTDFEILQLPEGITVEEAVEYLNSLEFVAYAEPDRVRRLHYSPNDPYYSSQWHLENLEMEKTWDYETGEANVVVAVLDSGVAYENYAGFQKAPDFSSTRFTQGYDFIDNDNHPNDEGAGGFGHGTFVAGVIAQATNNGAGVAGMAFNCTIMPMRVCSRDDACYDSAIAAAIRWSADNGADIINLSLGGYGYSQTLSSAINYAYGKGVAIFASSGNEGDIYPGQIAFPASHENVMAVGATKYDDGLSSYSNYGNGLDVVAPAGDMGYDQNGDGYGDGVLQLSFLGGPNDFAYLFADGTSFAAPQAAAVAALMMSYDSSLKGQPEVIYQVIRYSATDLGAEGYDTTFGYGKINPFKALVGLGFLD